MATFFMIFDKSDKPAFRTKKSNPIKPGWVDLYNYISPAAGYNSSTPGMVVGGSGRPTKESSRPTGREKAAQMKEGYFNLEFDSKNHEDAAYYFLNVVKEYGRGYKTSDMLDATIVLNAYRGNYVNGVERLPGVREGDWFMQERYAALKLEDQQQQPYGNLDERRNLYRFGILADVRAITYRNPG